MLTAFDLRSTLARKNPMAAIAAFEVAAAKARTPSRLLLKVVGADAAPDALAALQARIADNHDIILMTASLKPQDRDVLTASVDIVLSLHRAEGFGLLLAEGMAAGKAVIATGWSGNLDFMTPDSAVLVPYDLISVDDAQGLYAGGRWAQADSAFAAEALARLIDDPAARQAFGERAAAQAAAVRDAVAIGALAASWIRSA